MANLYDTLLALIPTSGVTIGGLLSLGGIDPTGSVLGGAGTAGFIILLAMFLWPPGGNRPSFMDNPALGPHQ